MSNYTGDGVGLHTDNNIVYNSKYDKELFALLMQIPLTNNEYKNESIHIIKSSEQAQVSFRLYCQNFCFDSYKREVFTHPLGIVSKYYFFSEWDGFDKIKASEAYNLILKYIS